MSRKDTIKYCNENIFPQIDIRAHLNKQEMLWIVGLVEKFRRSHGYPKLENMIARVDDGFLFINEIPLERIAVKLNRPEKYSEMADYWEGRILARQEVFDF